MAKTPDDYENRLLPKLYPGLGELLQRLDERQHVPPEKMDAARRELIRRFETDGVLEAQRWLRVTLPTLGMPRRFVSDRSRAIPNSPLNRD